MKKVASRSVSSLPAAFKLQFVGAPYSWDISKEICHAKNLRDALPVPDERKASKKER